MSAVPSRTIRYHQYGEPADVLRAEHVEIPDPPAERIRVRVIAVGLNPADWELCRGFLGGDLPRGIGLDVAGTVDAVGAGVAGVRAGDLVFGVPDFLGQPSAGAADVAILRSWALVPAGLGAIEASVLPMPVQTSAWTLKAMGVGAGSTVLIHGAGSTVGFAAVQVAQRMGARVIATAGRTYAAELERLGASVTPYGPGMADRVRKLAGGPVDHVLDTPPPNAGSLPALIEIAEDPHKVVTISNHDEARRLGARVNLDMITDPTPLDQLLRQYATFAANGEFRVPIARTYPFADWREAAALSMSGQARGKLVLLTEETVVAR